MTKHRERFLLQALRLEPQLRAYFCHSTRRRTDGEDLLQELYARLLRHGDTDNLVVKSIRTFAFTLAQNLAIGFARARGTGVPPAISLEFTADAEQVDASLEAMEVERAVDGQQELQLLAAALADIPKLSREVFTLRKVYGHSQGAALMPIRSSGISVSPLASARSICATSPGLPTVTLAENSVSALPT
jgi:DNA-directed RNA polymerase specialized sigma24 family protein